MTKKKIQTVRETAYQKYMAVGAAAVYDYANSLDIKYSHCTPCEADTPTLEDDNGLCECLVCGSAKES